MLLIYKNKGILIVPYLIASIIGTAIIVGILKRNLGGIFTNISFSTTMGLAFLITAVGAYLTKDDYYKDRNGQKKKIDIPNELFFMSMKVWAYIFLAAAVLSFMDAIFG